MLELALSINATLHAQLSPMRQHADSDSAVGYGLVGNVHDADILGMKRKLVVRVPCEMKEWGAAGLLRWLCGSSGNTKTRFEQLAWLWGRVHEGCGGSIRRGKIPARALVNMGLKECCRAYQQLHAFPCRIKV